MPLGLRIQHSAAPLKGTALVLYYVFIVGLLPLRRSHTDELTGLGSGERAFLWCHPVLGPHAVLGTKP